MSENKDVLCPECDQKLVVEGDIDSYCSNCDEWVYITVFKVDCQGWNTNFYVQSLRDVGNTLQTYFNDEQDLWEFNETDVVKVSVVDMGLLTYKNLEPTDESLY